MLIIFCVGVGITAMSGRLAYSATESLQKSATIGCRTSAARVLTLWSYLSQSQEDAAVFSEPNIRVADSADEELSICDIIGLVVVDDDAFFKSIDCLNIHFHLSQIY